MGWKGPYPSSSSKSLTYATVLSSSWKATLLNVFTGSSGPSQMTAFNYFFTEQLTLRNDTLWPSQLFSVCAPRARGFCTCVCLKAESQMTVFPGRGEFSRNKRRHFITASFRSKWPADESMPVLSSSGANYCQLSFTVEGMILAYTDPWKGLPHVSFPYLHIFYHLLYKEGCKCKRMIHLCWDKTHAHHSLIQQHIHQHLPKRNTKMSLGCYLQQASALNLSH